jgi:hypothetical protein
VSLKSSAAPESIDIEFHCCLSKALGICGYCGGPPPNTTTTIPNKILTSASTHCKNSQIFTKLEILLSHEQALKTSKFSALSPSCTRRRRRRRRIIASLHKEKNDEQSSLTKTHWKL